MGNYTNSLAQWALGRCIEELFRLFGVLMRRNVTSAWQFIGS